MRLLLCCFTPKHIKEAPGVPAPSLQRSLGQSGDGVAHGNYAVESQAVGAAAAQAPLGRREAGNAAIPTKTDGSSEIQCTPRARAPAPAMHASASAPDVHSDTEMPRGPAIPSALLVSTHARSFSQRVLSMHSRSRLALCTRAGDAEAEACGQQQINARAATSAGGVDSSGDDGSGDSAASSPLNTCPSPFVAGAAAATPHPSNVPPEHQPPLPAASDTLQDPAALFAARIAVPSAPASALVVSWVPDAERNAPDGTNSATLAHDSIIPVVANAGMNAAAVFPAHRPVALSSMVAPAALASAAASGRRASMSQRRLRVVGRASGSSASSFVADATDGTGLAAAVVQREALQAEPGAHAELPRPHDLERSPGPLWRSAEALLGTRILDTQFSFGADADTGAGGLGPVPRVAGVSPLLLASVGVMLASSMSEPAWTSGSPDVCLSSAAGTHHTPTGGGGTAGNGSTGAGGGSAGATGAGGAAAATRIPATVAAAAAAAAAVTALSSVGGRAADATARRGSSSAVYGGVAAATADATAAGMPPVSTVATSKEPTSAQSMQLGASTLAAGGWAGEATTQHGPEYAAAATAAVRYTAIAGTSSSGSRNALGLQPGGSERSDAAACAIAVSVPVAATGHPHGGTVRGSGGGGSGSTRSGAAGSGGAGSSGQAAHAAAPPGHSAGLAMVHVYPRSSRPQLLPGEGGAGAMQHSHSDSVPRCPTEAAAAATAALAPVSASESCLASTGAAADSGGEGLGAAGAVGREGRPTWTTAMHVEGGGVHDATSDLDSGFSVGGDVEGGPQWRCGDMVQAYVSRPPPTAAAATAAVPAVPDVSAGTAAVKATSTDTGSTCQSLSLNPQPPSIGVGAGGGSAAPARATQTLHAQLSSNSGRSARSSRSGEDGAAHGAGRTAVAAGAVVSGGTCSARSGTVSSGAGGMGAPRSMRLAIFPGHQASWLALQMHFFGGAMGAGGALEPRVPLSALASLDIARLSREVSALVWIGQGGGGAVFQGLWQGARVAVKFLLAASPAHVDASALEAIVSLSVAHPNVVHTYCAEVARVDEASLAEPAARPEGRRGSAAGSTAAAGAPWRGSTGGAHEDEDAAVTALYNALIMETTDMSQRLPPLPQPQPSSKGGSAAIDGVLPPQHLPPAAPAGDTGSAVANTGARRGTSTTGGGAASGGNSAAEVAASQRLQPPAADSHAITSFFESNEGFGEPDLASNDRAWTVRQVLSHMEAQPNMYLTHIIMEHCDRGSLLSAIKRGIFRLEPEAAVEAAEATGPSSASSLRSTAHSSKEGWATTVAAAASGASGGRPGLTRIPEAAVEAGRFPRRVVLRAILRTARDIAQGMAHLHANGIIHGDLKPGNVLLRGCRTDRRGFVAAVADFGLSKVVRGDQPLELDRWSTVTVMAPETIQGRWHKASDVYAFGILLWQLVTSEVMPYGNLTVGQILLGVSQGTLRPGWPGGVHPALVRLGRACLATNASERPSFDAIAKVLTKIETNVRNELREQQQQQRQRLQQQQLAVPAFVSEGGYSQEGPGGSSKAYVRKYSAV